ncbi:MAG: YHS domain-containing protein [Acidobacteriota bacterium]|nr:YHS domain-containing protein [Acidobacteriota bacterium]
MVVQCTVCEMELEPDNAVESIRDGEERLYFCSEDCLQQFREDPEAFLYEGDEEDHAP